ncbi:MAG: hypothetical protein GWM92_08950, partial [Gemmatimonadetes bacterium]|nr:hypothetical protein [Gemmatimonadota bacterium]NIR77976.1 hypothetical protein [Gemmatimonadota bacterium]NIT87408.1 hypothetical protein [Gemmatimonadota bacterium]NIU30372.1 hypothetical protein [Gemmatimonadota bacterium]NIU35254.1 hypothetical protein [Gemmatimonadota bacterium]
NLFDLRLTGGTARQDALRWPRQLYAKLVSLAGWVSGTDHAPTEQAGEVHRRYRERLSEYRARLDEVRDGPLAELNRLLEAEGMVGVPVAPDGG